MNAIVVSKKCIDCIDCMMSHDGRLRYFSSFELMHYPSCDFEFGPIQLIQLIQ